MTIGYGSFFVEMEQSMDDNSQTTRIFWLPLKSHFNNRILLTESPSSELILSRIIIQYHSNVCVLQDVCHFDAT